MEPIIDHIQITVKDMSIAEPFYDKLFSLLGFDIQNKGSAVIDEHEFHVVEYNIRSWRLPSLRRDPLSRPTRSIAGNRERCIILPLRLYIAPKSTGFILNCRALGHNRECTQGVSRIYSSRLLRSLL